MSLESARQFLDRADHDDALQSQLQKTGASFATIARDHGFEFTQDELHLEMSRRWQLAERRNDPDPLSRAASG